MNPERISHVVQIVATDSQHDAIASVEASLATDQPLHETAQAVARTGLGCDSVELLVAEDHEIGDHQYERRTVYVCQPPDDSLVEGSSNLTEEVRTQLQLRKLFLQSERLPLFNVATLTAAAHPKNEDALGWRDNLGWVVDGATPLDDETYVDPVSDAAWLATTASDTLRTAPPESDILDRLIESTKRIDAGLEAADYPTDRPLPSAAVGVVERRGDVLRYALLGDVVLAVTDGDDITVRDAPLSEQREEFLYEQWRTESRKAMTDEILRRRGEMNRRGGYWILSRVDEAIDHARVGYLSMGRSGAAGLFSDGFARVVSVFPIADWAEVLRSDEANLKRLLTELRARESADPDCVATPRLSAQDDASALVWRS